MNSPNLMYAELTPNPRARRYVIGGRVTLGGSLTFTTPRGMPPLVQSLFAAARIEQIHMSERAITVLAADDSISWDRIEDLICTLVPGWEPLLGQVDSACDVTGDDLLSRVAQVIDQHVRPRIVADGGGIEVVGIAEDGVTVQIRYQGACCGCPSATTITMLSIRHTLRQMVRSDLNVEAVG